MRVLCGHSHQGRSDPPAPVELPQSCQCDYVRLPPLEILLDLLSDLSEGLRPPRNDRRAALLDLLALEPEFSKCVQILSYSHLLSGLKWLWPSARENGACGRLAWLLSLNLSRADVI